MVQKRFLSWLFCLTGLLAAGAVPHVTLSTRNPRVGEVISIVIESDEGRPELLSYPRIPQVRFLTNRRSQSVRIVNFKTSYSTSIAVQMLKAGKVTIPPLKVRTGKHTYTIPRLAVQVLDRRAPVPRETAGSGGAGAPFGELATGGNEFYAGQEIPVECTLYVPDGTGLRQLGYPQLEMDKAVFSDFRKINPENPRFLRPVQGGTAMVGGRPCRTVVFRTFARIFEPGQYTFEATSPAAVEENAPDEEDDPFFSFSFFSSGRTRKIEVPYTAKPFTVKPLPPVPPGTAFTGLIGPYTVDFKLNGKNPAVGELLTLECRIAGGEGAPENFKAPELELPGFRVYPPEVRQESAGNTVIRYAMIPLREGKTPLKLALTVFDVKKGEYRTFRYEKVLQTAPAPAGRKPAAVPPAAVRRNAASVSPAPLRKLLPMNGPRVQLPLWRNCSGFVLFSVTAGILLILGSLFLDFLHRSRENDPAYAGRKAAAAARKAFLVKLHKAACAEDAIQAANRELCEYLSAKMGLPAGSSATEIAPLLRNREDAALLNEAGESAFQPGISRSCEEWKAGLLRLLKHVGILLLCCCGAWCIADEGTEAFERGDNKTAVRCFANRCRTADPDPAALHNWGCALAADGNEPMALLAYTRALRLAPRSGETLARLNEVREKLLLPPERSTGSPAELLRTARDQFRPDEYAAACAALFLLFAILFCFRRRLGRPLFSGVSLALLALGISFLLAIAFQAQGPYSPRNAFITARKAELRTLPAAKSGQVEATLSGGTPVMVLDEREHYVLVSGAGMEGWVSRADLAFLSCGKRK